MGKTRGGVVTMWLSLLGASLAGAVSGADAGAGILAPSVCLSPLVFGALILTPTATLSDAATKWVKTRANRG